jgi:hypothetical protein
MFLGYNPMTGGRVMIPPMLVGYNPMTGGRVIMGVPGLMLGHPNIEINLVLDSGSSCYSSSSDNVMTLYHETDADCARSILQSQTFRCGPGGLVGAGIYFAECASDTGHKAHRRGFILKARVNLGRIKIVEQGRENGVNAHSVSAEGCNSVKINRRHGIEYCVYDSSRITNIELA